MPCNMTAITLPRSAMTKDGSTYYGGDVPSGGDLASTPNLFADGFESGDISASSATLNVGGFSWVSPNTINIVTQDGEDNNAVYPAVFTNTTTTDDWTAKTGTYSILFDYSVGNPMSEQRFAYNAQPELWLRYWVKVPENYSHGTVGSDDTSKFLALWNTTYQAGVGGGATVWMSLFSDGSGGSTAAITHMDGNTGTDLAYAQHTPFITVPADRGRWMQMVARVKTETAPGAADGIIQTWRRWENESAFTQLHSKTDATLNEQTGGFQGGYLMGYINSTHTVDTFWRIDDFEMSTGSLL